MTDEKKYYLGVDLGSAYTKFVVVDEGGVRQHYSVIPTLSRKREALRDTVGGIREKWNISRSCSTGYGRNIFDSDIQKTELICGSYGVNALYPEHKSIIDIGGEDIKIIESGAEGEVVNFYMNDKCSAGTGAFITEIAEKVEMEIEEMSRLARRSAASRVINSFCTVFAKTEILGWKFDGVSIEDMARGIYLSIIKRICKLPVNTDLPVYLCGGVIAYHEYLQEMLSDELKVHVNVPPEPLFSVALGAAMLARKEERQ